MKQYLNQNELSSFITGEKKMSRISYNIVKC